MSRTVVIPAGESISINGLAVVLLSSLAFAIGGAETIDQNAELCAAHKLPVDLGQFAHTDEESGAYVQYSKNDGVRIETYPEAVEGDVQQDTALTEEAPIVEDPEAIAPDGEPVAVVAEDGEPTVDAIDNATSEVVAGEDSFSERIEKHESGE